MPKLHLCVFCLGNCLSEMTVSMQYIGDVSRSLCVDSEGIKCMQRECRNSPLLTCWVDIYNKAPSHTT